MNVLLCIKMLDYHSCKMKIATVMHNAISRVRNFIKQKFLFRQLFFLLSQKGRSSII